MTGYGTSAHGLERALRRPLRRDLLASAAGVAALLGAAAVSSSALAITPVVPPGLPVPIGIPQTNTGGSDPAFGISANEFDVALHAPRTVIDWSSYDITAGNTVKYTFDARNWIVLNRIQSATTPTIAGTIEGRVNGVLGGNIWFASANGLIFGAGAKVDAGGILVSTAAPDLAGFLDPANLNFSFPGSEITGDPSIDVQAGAAITGHGGLLALISPTIFSETGATVTGQGGSNVLYGAARGFQLHLQQGAPGDFDLIDFIIPDTASGNGGGAVMTLAGATTANSVFLASVTRAGASNAVINLQGMITAQAASTDGGDVVLSGGRGIAGRAAGSAVGGPDNDLYLHLATASRDIQLKTNGQVFGSNPDSRTSGLQSAVDLAQTSVLTAGRDFSLTAGRAVALGKTTAARNVTTDSMSLQANALTAGGVLSLKSEAGDIDLGALSVPGAGSVQANGAVLIDKLGLSGSAGQTLKIQAMSDITLGAGLGAAQGGGSGGASLTLDAGRNATINLASASLDTVTAAGGAKLQATGSLTVGSVNAQQVLAQGASVSLKSAASDGDVYVSATGGAATVGSATAGDDIYVLATGGAASLTSAALSGAGSDSVGLAFAGNPDAASNGRVVAVQSSDNNALLGLTTGAVSGATKINVQAGQDATVDVAGALPAGLTVNAQRDAIVKAASVNFDAVQAGRDITLTTTAGDLANTHALTAARNITVVTPGSLQLGDISATGGSIALTGRSVAAGALTAGQDLTLKATGGGVQLVSFETGRDLIVQGSSLSLGQQLAPVGRDLAITAPGDFTSASDLAAGRNINLSVGGTASLKGLSAPGTVDIVASDLTLGGAVSAANVQIESAGGALRVGGSSADGAPASGLWLDNAEFGRIRATGQVSLYAGPTGGSARGDLTLLALDITPQATPQVNFFVGGGRDALVQGVVAPTAAGGVLHIGDSGNSAWQPASILVSGTIGSADFSRGAYSNVRGFDDVRLFATQDIIIGSQRFIGLIQSAAIADIEIGRNKPAGVAPTGSEQNRVLITAGTLELSAAGKVVSQNTAPISQQSVGLFLNGKSAGPDLLIDPPQLVDLYGSFISQAGVLVTSFTAGAQAPIAIVDSAGNPATAPVGAVYRFNSCTVGTSQCSAVASVTSNLQQNTPILTTPTSSSSGGLASDLAGGGDESGGGGDSGGGGSSGGGGGSKGGSRADRNSGPSLLSIGSAEADEAQTDLVLTGAGSEEIWRKREPEKAPAAPKP